MNVTALQETQPSQPAGIILSLYPPHYLALQNGESQHPALTFIFSLSHSTKQKEVLGSGSPTRVFAYPSVTCQQAAVEQHSSEGISDVQNHPEGSSQNNGSKLCQNSEEKPKEMVTGKENVKSDGIGVEQLLSPGIQEEASIQSDRGVKKSKPDAGLKTGNDPFNYEDKYPEDNIYEETAPNARVWRTYLDESTNHDVRMVRESRDNVDVLLVFAGLFSAVVTTFISQTSQSLQADYAQVSASLLFEMILIQHAIVNGSSVDNIPVSSLNPNAKFTPATMDIWVNRLWFTSLSLSLTTALVTYRYSGFQKWHVLIIIGLLPVLMHLALGIFFVGLTVFLVPRQPGFSWVIGVGTVAAYTMYLITIFLPILYPQCPYHTPLSDLIYFPYCYITQDFFPKHVCPLFLKEVQWPDFTLDKPRVKIRSLDDLERGVVQEESETLSVEALHWLFSSSSNPTVHGIVIHSIGGLPLSARAAVKKVFREATHIHKAHYTLLNSSMQYLALHSSKPSPGMESKFERLLRFKLFIPHLYYNIDDNNQIQPYVDAADDEQGLTITVQSNNTLQRSKYKPPDAPTSTAFFRQVTHSGPVMLPPVIWLELMRMARDDGASFLGKHTG
ncbi:hypothetical protein EDD85DRAFT_798700 [Armillaria nabsnona]|nr:hypothetical protein EDD85DRAFT_798700 [Armillaria nabsnona]